jgi:hypothetical protein
MLRYRFGHQTQMQNHFHVMEGRMLFFWRDPRTLLQGGNRVVVEFSFLNSEQVISLRGSVLARIEGDNSGLWIEFPDSRTAKKLDQGPAALANRKQRRLGCDLMVELRVDGMPVLGRLVDVSMGGGRVAGARGLRPGSLAVVRLMTPEEGFPAIIGHADVVRSEGDFGIRFLRSDAGTRQASAKLFQAVQAAWSQAPELQHPSVCCQNGHVLEPPLPHMKNRT